MGFAEKVLEKAKKISAAELFIMMVELAGFRKESIRKLYYCMEKESRLIMEKV